MIKQSNVLFALSTIYRASAFFPVQSLVSAPQTSSCVTPTALEASTRRYEYKDDCFGFLSFGAAGATRDIVFAGIFITLSLVAAFATEKKWLPRDPKRDTIVDRRVPGAIAAITLLIATLVPTPDNVPIPIEQAKTAESVIVWFSFLTAFLDIRWRDRFDYPQEFRDL